MATLRRRNVGYFDHRGVIMLATVRPWVMPAKRRRGQFFVSAVIQPKQALDVRNEAIELGPFDRPAAQAEIIPRRHVVRRERHDAPAPGVRRSPERANQSDDFVLVGFARLLDRVQSVEPIERFPAAALLSRTTTRSPDVASREAAIRPAMPPPMTQTPHFAVSRSSPELTEVENHKPSPKRTSAANEQALSQARNIVLGSLRRQSPNWRIDACSLCFRRQSPRPRSLDLCSPLRARRPVDAPGGCGAERAL